MPEDSDSVKQHLAKSKTPSPKPAEETPPAKASGNFPKKAWQSIDYLLHNPSDIVAYIREDRDLWLISASLIWYTWALAAFYGGIMGAANLLQGADVAIGVKLLQMAVASVKVPFLFLFALVVVLPPIYVSNAFVGSHNSLRQVVAMLVCAAATTVTVLASMGTVALFFSLTSVSYAFILLMHVAFFAYAGVVGVGFLQRCITTMSVDSTILTPNRLLVLWLGLYGFVGTQLAWVLRPFVGNPNIPYTLFRPREGNFYEAVWRLLVEFMGIGSL